VKTAAPLLLLLLACASAPPPPAPVPAPLPGCGENAGEGEEGGVEGGVESGKNPQKFLPPSVGRAQLAVDLKDPQYRVQIPPEHARPGAVYWGLFKVCVSDAGQVTDVTTLRSTCLAQIDDAWTATIKTWSYRPYEIKGNRVPFCYPARLERRTPKSATEPGGSDRPGG
jgi:hypothetical protein